MTTPHDSVPRTALRYFPLLTGEGGALRLDGMRLHRLTQAIRLERVLRPSTLNVLPHVFEASTKCARHTPTPPPP